MLCNLTKKGIEMKKRKQKRIKTGEERCLLFDLFHNGLYRQKVVPNKKRKNDRKLWRAKREGYPLITFSHNVLKR